VLVADGGDFLSFARVGLQASTYLDPGSLGCIGVGTAFGIAASLACPGRQVVVATGDGAFGFNAMEIDTAVRHRAPVLIVVANNGAWQIEVNDQVKTASAPWWARGCSLPTTLRWRAPSACTASASSASRTWTPPSPPRCRTCRRCWTWW
jgi:thiamine pyrophosphate-dependent acetolactate synthase large subunit-like protein